MCGLVLQLNVMPLCQTASADQLSLKAIDVWCLSLPLPPGVPQVLEAQETVYQAVFTDSYDVCEDGALLLDDPLEDSLVPGSTGGANSAGESFSLEILSWVGIESSDLPPEDAQRFEEWDAIAGLVAVEITTALGATRLQGFALSYDDPNDAEGRVNTLTPNDILSDKAWDALELYWYGPDRATDACEDRCWDRLQDAIDNCEANDNVCLVATGLIGVTACLLTGGFACLGLAGATSFCAQLQRVLGECLGRA